jgi:RimJ/RimL family protein N-acetyltransferase
MTRRIIYGEDEYMCRWAANTIGAGGGFALDSHAIGMEIDGEIVAVTVWNNFETHNCLMSIASNGSKRWMNREFLFRSFAYPFIQLGLPRVTTKSAASNLPSIKLAHHLGFTIEGRMRKAAPGGLDDIVFGLLKEECRWIGNDFAKIAAKAEQGE